LSHSGKQQLLLPVAAAAAARHSCRRRLVSTPPASQSMPVRVLSRPHSVLSEQEADADACAARPLHSPYTHAARRIS
jgi:hypothetical protein